MLRLAVLASGRGSNFIRIAEACTTGEIPGEVVVLFTDKPDCGAAAEAAKLNIPVRALTPKSYESRSAFDSAAVQAIEEYEPQLLVFAGYMRLVDANFIGHFEGRMINVHPSLLPAFAGADGVRDAMDYGVKLMGATVHYVTEEMDSGPIVLQEAIIIAEGETEASIRGRIHAVEHRILPKAIGLIAQGKVSIDGRKTRIEL